MLHLKLTKTLEVDISICELEFISLPLLK